jgi:hypothetical protein
VPWEGYSRQQPLRRNSCGRMSSIGTEGPILRSGPTKPASCEIRNLQWYQPENAWCEKGLLITEGRRERKKNPSFEPESQDSKANREYVEYTSGNPEAFSHERVSANRRLSDPASRAPAPQSVKTWYR